MTSFKGFDAEAQTVYAKEASEILKVDHWHVVEGFRYYLGEEYGDAWIYVPAGYLTDGASVPRIFWNLLPPWGKYGAAAIVHDYLCEFLTIIVDGEPIRITRKQADFILLEAMEVLGVPWLTRNLMHGAVATYRVVARISEPTSTPLRRQLEADWVSKRNLKWQLSTN